jgi:hypothetical protein
MSGEYLFLLTKRINSRLVSLTKKLNHQYGLCIMSDMLQFTVNHLCVHGSATTRNPSTLLCVPQQGGKQLSTNGILVCMSEDWNIILVCPNSPSIYNHS